MLAKTITAVPDLSRRVSVGERLASSPQRVTTTWKEELSNLAYIL
jgi:hypothetical protein